MVVQTTPALSPALAAALSYAGRGWHVFPLRPRGKMPATAHGCNDATTDRATIRAWWSRNPDANIGIACGPSGLVVVDLDKSKGGLDAWADLRKCLGFDDATVMCLTGGDGVHLYYAAPEGVGIRNSAGRLGEGIDVRAEGGYVVAPPSVHPNGTAYAWEVNAHPDDRPIAPLPKSLLPLLSPTAPTAVGGDGIPEGRRNDTLTSLAGSMRRKGASEAEIVAVLAEINESQCRPPLEYREVARIARSVARYAPADGNGDALLSLARTDAGNAEAMAALFGDEFRYECSREEWLVWDGARWTKDADGEAKRATLLTMRKRKAVFAEKNDDRDKAQAVKWALQQESQARLHAALDLARSTLPFPVVTERLDADPDLLACPNGTVDLRTGEFREARREDLITRLAGAPYDPNAPCPRWTQFLREIFGGDDDLIAFVQRAAGYSLTGDVREQALFILYGTGANGKTTFLEALRNVWGDYARTTPFATFESDNRDDKRADLASLRGVRFVSATEAEDGRRLAESRVKTITGGDRISCRHLYGHYFEYVPAFKVWMATNYKPAIRGTDHGIWRRIRLIPFTQQFVGNVADPNMLDTLRGEASGILAWAVRGCLDWRAHQLGKPDAVDEATQAYRLEEDVLGQFLADCTTAGNGLSVQASELYAAYKDWCEVNGEKPMTGTSFGRRIVDRGIHRVKGRQANRYEGIELRKASAQEA
jgi:putative DNA primase/helicase